MNKIIFIAVLVLTFLFSCSKEKVAKGTPTCIKQKIDEFSKTECNDGVKVDEYKFEGDVVYVFEPGYCGADMTSEVIDEDCNTLGYLGGIAGNTKINGVEFSKANFVKNTWKK